MTQVSIALEPTRECYSGTGGVYLVVGGLSFPRTYPTNTGPAGYYLHCCDTSCETFNSGLQLLLVHSSSPHKACIDKGAVNVGLILTAGSEPRGTACSGKRKAYVASETPECSPPYLGVHLSLQAVVHVDYSPRRHTHAYTKTYSC